MEKPSLEKFGLSEEQLSSTPNKKFKVQDKLLLTSHLLFLVGSIWLVNVLYTGKPFEEILPSYMLYGVGSLFLSSGILFAIDAIENKLLSLYHPDFYLVQRYREANQRYEVEVQKRVEAHNKIQEVVNAYGKVLEDSENRPSTTNLGLRDITELPYPKEIIKPAMLYLMGVADRRGDERYKQILIACYTFLSDFQANVGRGIDLNENDVLQVARGMQATQEIRTTAEQERKELINDLKKHGYWSDKDDVLIRERTKAMLENLGLSSEEDS